MNTAVSDTTGNTQPTIRGLAGGVAPPHVPENLIHRIDAFDEPNDRIDPFGVTENIYEDLPPIFFWPKPRPGMHDGLWVVTRYEDIRNVYQLDEYYSTRNGANFQTLVGETFTMLPLAVDKPEHTRYRNMLNPWFSPKAVDALETQMRATIAGLIDAFAGQGRADAAHDYGRIYPVRVFLNLMGFPQDRLDDFLQWEYAILHSRNHVETMKWGISSALAFLRDFIEKVRLKPDEGLASKIVHGQVAGRPLTEDEIIGTIFFLWVGGLDTVAATTALMLRRLALEPALQQRLRDDPGLITDAIEEFLRMQPLVNSTRLVVKDHEIAGQRVRAGDYVMCLNTAGNFDPAEFENPREVRFDRTTNRHFTLAGGAHRCLGSHLARRELRIALSEFLRRVPPFRLADGADRKAVPGLIAVARVPVVWDGDILPA